MMGVGTEAVLGWIPPRRSTGRLRHVLKGASPLATVRCQEQLVPRFALTLALVVGWLRPPALLQR